MGDVELAAVTRRGRGILDGDARADDTGTDAGASAGAGTDAGAGATGARAAGAGAADTIGGGGGGGTAGASGTDASADGAGAGTGDGPGTEAVGKLGGMRRAGRGVGVEVAGEGDASARPAAPADDMPAGDSIKTPYNSIAAMWHHSSCPCPDPGPAFGPALMMRKYR